MPDRYMRTVVRCSNCGEEIGRGDNLGFASALCAKCSDEIMPQFVKDPVPEVIPVVIPRRQDIAPIPEPYVVDSPESHRDTVAISIYEDPKKKPAAKKSVGKSVSKAIKSLGRIKK